MSISFYGYVLDDDGWTWPDAMRDRWQADILPPYDTPEYWAWYDGDPAAEAACRNPNYDSRLDVNLHDLNAQLVLNELGFLNGSLHASVPVAIDVFEIGLHTTMARNPDPIPGLDGCDTIGTRGCRMISPGTPDGYVNECFERLLALVTAAREYGATHIGWS